jgi:alkanesulfonate monooxygenase SsuD/methylene tetrahydromethanopterin reductase-like flavin-dependent oxidoreductase (luciferase family)
MDTDLRIRTVDAEPASVIAAAIAAERAGFSAVWLADQLSGETSGGRWNLECWTMLSAIAAQTTRVKVGPLVLNIANRDAATTALAASTLQRLSGGRLLFGLGAGAGATSQYSRDQLDLGRVPGADQERRAALVAAIRQTRKLWAEGDDTFLKPDPHPPIIIGAFGPKVARLAAEEADGIAVPLDGYMGGPPMEELIAIARVRREEIGSKALITIVHSPPRSEFDEDRWLPGSSVSRRLLEAGIDRFVLQARPDAEHVAQVDSRLVMAHA